MKPACLDCRFYERRKHFEGICRRRAPFMLRSRDIDYPLWPRVIGGADWCGDFEASADAEKDKE